MNINEVLMKNLSIGNTQNFFDIFFPFFGVENDTSKKIYQTPIDYFSALN
jgi:hypothetical protein